MRGCLVLLVVFAVALVVERQMTSGLGLPFPDILAAVLAVAATLTVGTLQGIQQAKRQQEMPQHARATWTDGVLVRVEGTLVVNGAPAKAPFSDRPAAFLDYDARAPLMGETGDTRQRPHWRGFVAVACALDIGGERIPLRGMPGTREWTEDQFSGEPYVSRAAHHLVSTTWTRQAQILAVDAAAAIGAFTAPADARIGSSMHVMNPQAARAVGMADGDPQEAEVAARLREQAWIFGERLVEPGTVVTVVGTWHAASNSLDIALSPTSAEHALHLGGAAPLAARQWRTTLIFSGIIALVTAAAHYVALANGGALYRSLVSGIAQLR